MSSNPVGKGAVPEEPQHDAPTSAGATTSDQSRRDQVPPPEIDSLPPVDPHYRGRTASLDDHPPDSTPRSRRLQKKLWRPMVLAILGLGLLGVGIELFPSRSESPTPSYVDLSISSKVSISTITYDVSQVSPSVDRIKMRFYYAGNKSRLPASSTVVVDAVIPAGFHFRTCPQPYCSFTSGPNVYTQVQSAAFKKHSFLPGFGMQMQAIAYFFIKAHDFGETYNGVNASVALPQIQYTGPGSPTVAIQYHLPSASSYDWSSFQTYYVNGSYAVWSEQLTKGLVAGRAAVGINFTNQKRDNQYTFLAGALVGLAGGALLSAVQEALHAND